jgi:GT2 family glycosyltransferase/glycosyltransferase involved in cell wall biosynthesis
MDRRLGPLRVAPARRLTVRILIVVHGFPPLASGGTEVFADLQARCLAAAGDEVHVFAREAKPARPEYAVRDERRDGLWIRWVNRTFRDTTRFAESYDAPGVTDRLAQWLDREPCDIAHIHHLTCLSTGIVRELKSRQVPVVLTLHDYWMLCHRGQLLDLHLRRCENPTSCHDCLGPVASASPWARAAGRSVRALTQRAPSSAEVLLTRAAGAAAGRLIAPNQRAHDERLLHMRAVLRDVDRILAPSRHMRDRFARAGVDQPIDLLEYGIDTARFAPRDSRRAAPFRVGYLGSLMVSKAPHLLVESWKQLPPGTARLSIAGGFVPYHGDDSYQRTIAPLLSLPGVEHIGSLPNADVPRWLSGLDALVVPSIWEENSPLVIREAFAAGVPVIASRIGGIPEVIADEVNGLLFDPGNLDDLTRQLRRVTQEHGLIDRLRSGIPSPRSIEDAARETRAIYEGLFGQVGRVEQVEQIGQVARVERVAAVVLNYKTPDETLLAVRSLLASRTPFAQILVVDNASDDECREALREVMGEITFVSAGGNTGFPAGVNLGIRHALAEGATHVMLVNSDVMLPVSTLRTLLDALASDPTRGIAAPVIAARQLPDIVASAGMRFSDVSGRMRHALVGTSMQQRFAAWQPVAGVSGCAMLLTREVFDAVGLLPESYFFSFEDLAFCLDVRQHGFNVGVVGNAVAYHEGSRSMGATSPRRLYFASRNHLLLASTRPGSWLARTGRATAIIGYNAAYAFRSSGAAFPARLAAVARGVRDHLRGRYGSDEDGQL